MRRLASVSLVLTAIAIPVAAFAYYSKPSELLAIKSLTGKPVDFAYELHGSYEDNYGTMWLKGSMEGKDTATFKGRLNVTLDIAFDGESMRAKAEARVKDKMLYVSLQNLEGRDATGLSAFAEEVETGQWYAMPLEDLQEKGEAAAGVDEEQAADIARQVMDAMLTLTRAKDGDGSVYSLKLKRNAAAELKKTMTALERTYPDLETGGATNSDVSELRKLLSRTRLHIKVMTDAGDLLRGIKFYVSYTERAMALVVEGTVMLRSSPVTVQVPAHAQMLNESLPDGASL